MLQADTSDVLPPSGSATDILYLEIKLTKEVTYGQVVRAGISVT